MKKIIITLLLAGFVLADISPAVCIAKSNTSEPQKISVSKTQKNEKEK